MGSPSHSHMGLPELERIAATFEEGYMLLPQASPFPQGREPSMEAGDWRGKWPADMRQSVINKIISTLKTACPISGQEGLEELERSAASLEEKSYAAANSQLDYLQKNSQEMVTVVTKPQNTISNSLESNGKGLLVSVPDQGHSLTMSLPAIQSQTRQQFTYRITFILPEFKVLRGYHLHFLLP
uniref:mediator of RNA polymerase II transcription subunit 15a-like isoform X3 n=2 Tax=Fragaria vesca subsp. vesca TaxID=101020 RepID=UPI0005C88627|nr:PREDICTED: mediator of RNA polymerase II transcription subunit 15a-like isoform X3 [Fragaria vesca subsp. vesca]